MRALHIDTDAKTVRAITLDPTDTLAGMQAAVGGHIERATELPNGDDLYVNDEGMINGTQVFFYLPGWMHYPLAGHAIITGHDGEGETVAATTDLEDVADRVRFIDRRTLAALLQLDSPD